MKVKFLLLLFIFALIGGCSDNNVQNESNASKVVATEVQEADTKEQEIIGDLKLYAAENDLINLSKALTDAKKMKVSKEELDDIVNSFIDKLIDERDFPFLLENQDKIVNINRVAYDDRYKFRDFMSSEITPLLDEMETAVNNKEFNKVDEMFSNEALLKDNEEASAMYHYSLYLQTSQNSYEDSVALALAVKYDYSGRLKEEIRSGVTDTSYAPESGITFPGPIDDYFWRNAEDSAQLVIDIQADSDRNKQEGEAEREWAKDKNPTIGMTTAQVEVSLWGKPEKINRTVNQYHTREQWVYGQGQYLYFTDGILTSFQD